ncbi:MAG: type II toxin-antitoxin system HicB family antitoxin [Lachnospiraceae bacterium]
MYKYERVIYWSEDDNKFLAVVPELPGCMSDGDTAMEALENVEVVMKEWIETAKVTGREIPEIKGRMETQQPDVAGSI